jgi:hypothetical protein
MMSTYPKADAVKRRFESGTVIAFSLTAKG